MTMKRNGYQDGSDQSIPFEIDDLIYGYAANSNQLRSVYDQSFKTDGFKDGPSSSSIDLDYDYDAFGNLIKDRNKGIPQNGIKYNHLNLPTSITFDNGSTITYLYNAVGAKLEKKVSTTSSTESTLVNATDYVGGFQYKDNDLQFFPTAEGYVSVIEGPKFNYVFNYTDHLGNIRLSYTQSGTELKIMEENHYYPFGLKHSNYNTDIARLTKSADGISVIVRPTERSDYQYKYNGKELQDELGLNMYAMDARMYDPAIARWVVQDPVLHYNMSPYNAFDNNPVFWADPSGADATSLINDLWNKSSSGVTQYTKTGNGTFEQTDHVSDKELNNGMAILVAFPDQNPAIPSNQRTAKWLEKTFGDNDGKMNNAGHAGIIIIDGDTGFSRYFDFGRYEISSLGGLPADTGAVRSSASFSGLSVPNWDFKKSDIDNVSNMLTTIKNSSVFKGYGTIMGTLAEGLDFKAMLKYATEFEKKGYHPFGGYSSSTNPSNPTYCAKFARGVAGAGGFDWSYYVLSGKASVDDINKTNQCGVVKY
jgi:RHS repeat-associated protein